MDNSSVRKPLTTKLHFYEALYALNRGFDFTLLGLKRLEELGVFQDKNLSAYEVMLEQARAGANEELTGVLQEYEQDDAAYWDQRNRERREELADPDDVFLAARDRKQQIKEQMKGLQAGLARQRTRKKKRG